MSELQDSEVRLPDEVVSTPVAYESFNDGKDLQRALSTRQVAQWLRVSESEVERLATTGELPARKLAGAWRFGAVALNRWIEVNSDPRTTPEPVVEKVEQLSAQWRDLSTRLEKVLEPVIEFVCRPERRRRTCFLRSVKQVLRCAQDDKRKQDRPRYTL